METQVKKQLQDFLQGWIEHAVLSVDPKTAATAASWAIYRLALQWSHGKKRPPVEGFADQALPLIAVNLGLTQPL